MILLYSHLRDLFFSRINTITELLLFTRETVKVENNFIKIYYVRCEINFNWTIFSKFVTIATYNEPSNT